MAMVWLVFTWLPETGHTGSSRPTTATFELYGTARIYGGDSIASSRAGVVRRLAQYAIQPSPGFVPITLNTDRRDPQNIRGFLNAQSSEIAQLHHAGLPSIDLSQRLQCFIQGQYFDSSSFRSE